MAKRIGDASPPAGNISLRSARRELIDAVHSDEKAKAMSDYSDAMASEARNPGRINAIANWIDAIEDKAIRSIRDAMTSGGIAAYFEGHGGERSIPPGWLDADWLRKKLLIDGAIPIDECNNRDRNGSSERLVYFRSEEWKALLSKLVGAPSVAVVPTDAGRAEYYSMVSIPGKQHEWVFRAMVETWKDHRVPRKSIAEIENAIASAFKRISGKDGGPGQDNIRRILVWNGKPLKK